MNKVDVLLNSIAHKHLRVEVVHPALDMGSDPFYHQRLHAALLCAFKDGVRYASNSSGLLIESVDIDVSECPSAVNRRSPAKNKTPATKWVVGEIDDGIIHMQACS